MKYWIEFIDNAIAIMGVCAGLVLALVIIMMSVNLIIYFAGEIVPWLERLV